MSSRTSAGWSVATASRASIPVALSPRRRTLGLEDRARGPPETGVVVDDEDGLLHAFQGARCGGSRTPWCPPTGWYRPARVDPGHPPRPSGRTRSTEVRHAEARSPVAVHRRRAGRLRPARRFPVFGSPARLPFVSFAEASVLGAALRELPGGASVNDLMAVNPLDVAVLFYEGEEVRGAQQDRTLDVSVLVAAGAGPGAGELRRARALGRRAPRRAVLARAGERLPVAPAAQEPVGAGRGTRVAGRGLGGGRGQVTRGSARRATRARCATPSTRGVPRSTSRRARSCAATGSSARSPASAARSRCSTSSADPTSSPRSTRRSCGAMRSTRSRRRRSMPRHRSPTWRAFIASVLSAPRRRRRAVGLGEDVRFASPDACGAALEAGGELIALTAFPGESAEARIAVRRVGHADADVPLVTARPAASAPPDVVTHDEEHLRRFVAARKAGDAAGMRHWWGELVDRLLRPYGRLRRPGPPRPARRHEHEVAVQLCMTRFSVRLIERSRASRSVSS